MPRKANSGDPSAPATRLTQQARRFDRHVLSLALAIGGLGLLGAQDAKALALGRVTVMSALGEPLRAEVDIPDINTSEAESLRSAPASPSVYRAQGIDYNAALGGVTVSLQRRPDGRYFLRLTGSAPINDPYLDLILETSWSSGRLVRDYTLLFDPPAAPPPRAADAPAASPAPAAAVAAAVTPPVVTAPSPLPPRTAAARRASAPAPAPNDTKAGPDAGARQVTVRPGDTASRIAAAVKPAGVSLDQMLVAMLAANPDAFIDNNVNRIRAGAVLNVPDANTAGGTTNEQASANIQAQARDFDDFRRRLAGAAPRAAVDEPQRSASGRVQARVVDRKPTQAAPDRLTLSKGAVAAASAADQAAQSARARDAQSRTAEIERNISELDRVKQSATGASGAAPASAAGVPAAAPVAAPSAPTAPAAPASAASAPAAAPAASVAPAAPTSRPVAAPAPPPPPEASFVDELLENPLVPAAAGGLIAALAGLGLWRLRQRRGAAKEADSSFLESKLQPDSFFGTSGGQKVDTNSNDSNATGASSLAYSPSQLDAAGDVDPVAEADVYLAYGRDMQAEEILKEALKTNPNRLAIHAKLLEIYAKRKDITAFTAVAADAYRISGAKGPEWDHIASMGRELDPSNPMYQATGVGMPPAPVAVAAAAAVAAPAGNVDVDLDLDFSDASADAPAVPDAPALELPLELPLDLPPELPPEPAVEPPAAAEVPMIDVPELEPAAAPVAADAPTLDLNFEPSIQAEIAPAAVAEAPAEPAGNEIDFSLDLNPPAVAPAEPVAAAAPAPAPAAPAPAAAGGENMIEFDLGSLTLDLENSTPAHASAEAPAPVAPEMDIAGDDPLATKLALAEEFSAIGDADGARALIEEVIAESSGAVKARAQRMLESLT